MLKYGKHFLISFVFCFFPLKLVKAEAETADDDVNITPELTRELLVSALKLLVKEKSGHVTPLKPDKVLQYLPAQPKQPCSNVIHADKNPEEAKASELKTPAETIIGRRSIVTTSTAIAKDPVTGLNRVVTYPVVYPTYGRYIPISSDFPNNFYNKYFSQKMIS